MQDHEVTDQVEDKAADAGAGDRDAPSAPVAGLSFSQRRWTQFVFFVGAFLAFWLGSNIVRALWGLFAEPESAPAEAIAAVVALAFAVWVYRKGRTRVFVDESVQEMAQVTWPSREETWRSTYIVVAVSLVAAALLFMMDAIWAALTDYVYKA